MCAHWTTYLAILLCLVGCNSKQIEELKSRFSPKSPAGSTPVSIPVAPACQNFRATIVKRFPEGTAVALGAPVTFEVKAEGCSSYQLVVSEAGPSLTIDFNSNTFFQRTYTTLSSSFIQKVKVRGMDQGQVVGEIEISSPPFSIGQGAGFDPSNTAFRCHALVTPSLIDIPVTPDYVPLEEPPMVDFLVTSNRPGKISKALNLAGAMSLQSGLPHPTGVSLKAKIASFGMRVVAFHVEEDGTNKVAQCDVQLLIRERVVMPPPPPRCQLFASPQNVPIGGEVRLTLLAYGLVAAADISGTPVPPLGGTIGISPLESGNAVASVVGPGGRAFCSASYTVQNPKPPCHIYYQTSNSRNCDAQNPEVFAVFVPPPTPALVNGKRPSSAVLEQAKFKINACNGTPIPDVFVYNGIPLKIKTGGMPGSIECPAFTARKSPLVVDTRSEGIQLIPPDQGPRFDLSADGQPRRYSWPANPASVMFLVYDKNSNGLIENVNELFGDNTVGPDGQKSPNGFDALKKHDADNNGRIGEEDPVFQKLQLWSDANRNGLTESGELYSLADKNIRYFDLKYDSIDERIDFYGNSIGERSFVVTKNGQFIRVYDLWFVSGGK